jgi:hypothetical protein
VVEDDHAVVEREAQVRNAAVVRRRVRQALDVAHGVVAGVADRPAAEPRQPRQVRRAVAGDEILEHFQRVGVTRLDPRLVAVLHADLLAVGLDPPERPAAEEAVPADLLAADDALEEEPAAVAAEFRERGHRRQRVGDELAVDGDDGVRTSEGSKLVERRTVTHGGLAGDTVRDSPSFRDRVEWSRSHGQEFAMSTVTIDAVLSEKLAKAGQEVPLAGPDGRQVGYFLSPQTYESMKKALYDWAFARVTTDDLRRALADPRRHSMEEVLKLVEGD